MPTTMTKRKKAAILIRTTSRLESAEPPMLVTMVKAIRPSTSSIKAAARMVLPTTVDSLPISLRVSTVMETEVAVNTTPIKIFCINALAEPLSLKKAASTAPPSKGISTPHKATINPVLPVCLRSSRLVPNPAVNIITMTPSSETWLKNSVLWMIFRQAGPIIKPASRAPTTCGICNRLVRIPRTLVETRMRAMSTR